MAKNNDKQANEAVVAKLKEQQRRADQQPVSYKMLFDEAIELAAEQFKRAMTAEAKLAGNAAFDIDRLESGDVVQVRARVSARQTDRGFLRVEFEDGGYGAAPVACILPHEVVAVVNG